MIIRFIEYAVLSTAYSNKEFKQRLQTTTSLGISIEPKPLRQKPAPPPDEKPAHPFPARYRPGCGFLRRIAGKG
jgi:hypothetical protein